MPLHPAREKLWSAHKITSESLQCPPRENLWSAHPKESPGNLLRIPGENILRIRKVQLQRIPTMCSQNPWSAQPQRISRDSPENPRSAQPQRIVRDPLEFLECVNPKKKLSIPGVPNERLLTSPAINVFGGDVRTKLTFASAVLLCPQRIQVPHI